VSPRIWSEVDAHANCPQDFVMFQNSGTRLLALQCSKVLPNLGLMTLSQISPKIIQHTTVHLQYPAITTSGGNSTFFWRGQGKNTHTQSFYSSSGFCPGQPG